MLRRGSLNVTAMVAVLALALTTVIGGVVLAPRAEADPLTPVVTLAPSPDGPKGVLAGENETVRLTVSNPSTDPWFNLSVSVAVPAGVEFVAAPDLGAPKVYRSGARLPDGTTVPAGQDLWVWQDVSDLPGTAARTFDIEVAPAQPARGTGETDDTAVFPVGSDFDMVARGYTSTDARYVPVFPGGTSKNRAPAVAATLSSAASTSTTDIRPFRVTKDEPSPESELLRGVHDRTTTYTLTVKNTSEGPTEGAVVTDYLPAGLEFLGCGATDNTADLREEYTGSGTLEATPAVADCLEATTVTTVEKTADNAADFPADLADGVYTRVVWGPLDLAADETLSIVYAAGIPQQMNTMTWANGADPDELGEQAANLDNNSGATTRHSAGAPAATDGDVYRNVATVTGSYEGVVRTGTDRLSSDDDDEIVYSMDVRVLKSVDTQPTDGDPTAFDPGSVGEFFTGSIAKYTLNVSTSEYVDASDITLVDVVPNGLCPVLPAGVTVVEGPVQVPQLDGSTQTFTGAAAADFPGDCIPGATTGAGAWADPEVSGADVDWVAYDPDQGRFVLSLSVPGTLAALGSHDVVYPVLMRGSYAGEEGTTSSLDDFTNSVVMTATTTGLHGAEQGVTTTVADDSAATIVAGPSTISKKVLPREALVGETVCPAEPSLYVEGDDPTSGDLTFAFGDTVCYELTVNFAADADTRNPVITDMLPEDLLYVGSSATLFVGADEVPDVSWDDSLGTNGNTLRWRPSTHEALNGDRLVPLGSRAVIHVWGTVDTVSETKGSLDKPQNLMKYQQENVRGELFFLRDEADVLVDAGLQLVKGVRDVDGDAGLDARTQQNGDGTVFGSNRDGIEVVEGSAVTYRIDLSGAPQDVSDLEVWDKLPAGISVDDVTDISDGGTVEQRGNDVYVVWTGLTVAKGAESTLTYTVTIPDETAVASTLLNTASIQEYVLDTNTGTPSEVVRPGEDGVPTTGTVDTSDVFLPDASVTKRVVSTEVDDAGNNGSGSPVPPATTPLPQAVHGEYLTYEYSVTVPARTSVLEGVLEDSGLVSGGTAVTTVVDPARSVWTLDGGDPSTMPAFGDFVFDASTGVLTFPESYDNTTDDPQTFAVQVTLYVVGQVPPADALLGHGDVLDNTATFTSTTGNHSADAASEYVVPEPVVTKTVDNDGAPVTADEVLTYTLTATNTTGRPTSFATVVTDCVPAALVDVTPGTPTQGTVDTSGTCADGGTQVVWTVGDLVAGETQTLTYTVVVSPEAAGGVSYTNTADLVGYVLADVDPTGARQLELTSSDSATVTVQDATIVKTVDEELGSIGDVREFVVTVTLPKNVNFYSPQVTDEVPQGLKVDPTSVRIEAPGTGVTFGCDPTTGPGTDGGDILCTADGNILAAPDDRTVTLSYSATVVQSGAPTSPTRGAELTNTAKFSWAPAAGSSERTDTEAEATVTVTEPDLAVKKYVEGQDAQDAGRAVPADPSTTLSYSIEVTSSSAANVSTAYDVTVTDDIPAGLTNVQLPDTMPVGVEGTIEGDLVTWTIAQIAPGETVVLTLTADLVTSPDLRGGQTITNTAEVTEYWSNPAPTDGTPDDEHRSYVGGTDPAVVEPVFPFVSVVKTVGDGPTAEVGTPFPWVLTITNSGGGLAQTVTATDTLPVGWDSPVVTAVTRNGVDMDAADWDFDADAVVWTFRDVAADDVIVVGYTTVPTADAYTAPGAGVGPSATGPDNPHTNTVALTVTDTTGEDENGDGDYVGDPDSADAFLRATNVTVTKERVGTDRVWTGDEVTFTLTATNEGPQAADAVTIEDTLPAGLTFVDVTTPVTFDPATWTCSDTDDTVSCVAVGPLAAGDSVSVTVTAKALAPTPGVLSEDVVNTATVSTSTPETDLTDNTDTEPVTVWARPAITIDKTADVSKAAVVAGDDDTQYVLDGQDPAHVAHFSITVTNTGPVELVSVEVVDLLAEQCSSVTIPDLAPAGEPGDSYTYTCDGPAPGALGYTNTATVTAESTNGDPVEDEDTSRVELSAIDLVKTGTITQVAPVPGDVVTFGFVVTNTGSSTLTGVTIDDQMAGLSGITFGTWPGDEGTLEAGQSVSATATYELTLADVDARGVRNSATATGTDPAGQLPTDDGTVTVVPGNAPSIDLVKTGELLVDPDEEGTAGDTVVYTFVATNTGNVTLDDVAVSDLLEGLGDLTYDWSAASAEGTLAPQESVTATAEYVLTQADVDAGRVDNTATVEGLAPDGSTVDDDDSWVVPIVPQPLVDLVKTGALADGSTGRAGDLVEYTFTVTNPGSVTLTDVSISDLLTGLSDITYTWPGAEGVVAPGQELVARASYTLTQEDVDLGRVDNEATVVGTPPTGSPVDSTDDETVVVPALPDIELVKTGAVADGSQGLLGDTVEYTFTATNTGNVTLDDVQVSDVSLPGLSPLTLGDWPGAPGVLAPGEAVTATATYVLTQADVELGYVDNVATTEGTSPGGVVVDDEDEERVATLQTPVVVLEKAAALASGQPGHVGDVVEYGFTVRNEGNVTLTGVEISDPMPGLSELVYSWPGTPGVLLPGEEATATAEYVLTQQDVDRGTVDNTAEVVGTAPGGREVTDLDEADVPLPQAPSIALVKTATLADGATGVAGDTVTYSFEVTNTGDVTLFGVTVTDPLEGVSEIAFGPWPGDVRELAPGASVTATATYVLTQADVDAGSVTNVATASGTPQVGPPVTADDTVTVPTTQRPAIALVKTGVIAGDSAEYSFTVTNTGTVTLTGVVVSDPLPGLSELTYGTWPAAAGTLAPGESVTASATLTLTQAHLDAGSVVNTATVTGTSPSGDEVTATDEVTLTTTAGPAVPGDGGDTATGPGGLPTTGAAVLGLALLAAILVAGGLVLLRRRRHLTA